MKRIFVGPNGIRSGWRFLIFVSIVMGLGQGLRFILIHAFHYQEPSDWVPSDFLLTGSLFFLSALFAAFVMSRIENRTFRDYGLPANQAFGSFFWFGILWGFGTSAVEVLLIYLAGGLSFHGWALQGNALIGSALAWFGAFVMLGLWEEFMFRGYPLTKLATGIGFWPASIVMCLLFGLAHIGKPMENWIDITSIMLYGLLWCFSLRRTGSIWFAIGFHAMSDYADMVIFAAPNTGNDGRSLTGHLLDIRYHGPEWLTGGPRGIESSLMVFVILVASFYVLHRIYPESRFPPKEGSLKTTVSGSG
jgi:membrane protease YdiL (CAAX protease family)